jgi:hypothetical protein
MSKMIDKCIERIGRYNDLIGKTSGSANSNPEFIESQISAIKEELSEFYLAESWHELELDALCDIFVTCAGYVHIYDEVRSYDSFNCFVNVMDVCSYLSVQLKKLSYEGIYKACVSYIDFMKENNFREYYFADALVEVCDSNDSKACINSEEVKQTIEKYKNIGVKIHFNELDDLFMPICSESVVGLDGKHYFKGKGLKSINYKKPNLKGFVK